MTFGVHRTRTSAHKLPTSEKLHDLHQPQLELIIHSHSKDGMHIRNLSIQSHCFGILIQLTFRGIQGRVRTKTVKKSAKVIIERYYPKLTLDFETNKRICDEIAIIASKRLRNKVCPSFSASLRTLEVP